MNKRWKKRRATSTGADGSSAARSTSDWGSTTPSLSQLETRALILTRGRFDNEIEIFRKSMLGDWPRSRVVTVFCFLRTNRENSNSEARR